MAQTIPQIPVNSNPLSATERKASFKSDRLSLIPTQRTGTDQGWCPEDWIRKYDAPQIYDSCCMPISSSFSKKCAQFFSLRPELGPSGRDTCNSICKLKPNTKWAKTLLFSKVDECRPQRSSASCPHVSTTVHATPHFGSRCAPCITTTCSLMGIEI